MSDIKKAQKKAKAWFRRDDLLTEPVDVEYDPPTAMVDVGHIVAIEYSSDKFDGKTRVYRHDVTKKRRMYLSPDGSTIVVDPPFRVTTRGIEG